MSLPSNPEQFVQYFERVNREYPGEHWVNGIAVAEWWLALSRQERVSQTEVDEIVARLRAEPNPGTGWTDLTWQFGHWAGKRGFRVQPVLPNPNGSKKG